MIKFLLHDTDGYECDHVIAIYNTEEDALKAEKRLESRKVDGSILRNWEINCLPDWLDQDNGYYYYVTECEYKAANG